MVALPMCIVPRVNVNTTEPSPDVRPNPSVVLAVGQP